jgi:hypothetical protein
MFVQHAKVQMKIDCRATPLEMIMTTVISGRDDQLPCVVVNLASGN